MSDPRQTGAPAVTATTGEAGPVGTKGRPSFARTLTFFGFFAITASMVMTVYEYPSFASSGFQLVFFLIIGGILWFLPVALCAAEMATVKGWESGGIFAWVGNTLGRRWGFAALFFQWFQITVGFVTMAFFILAAFAYVVRWDALYNNPLVMFFGVAAIVWLLTLTQLGGTKYTARISKVGFVGGIIVPVLVLLVGLVIYFATGGVSQITMDAATFVPNFGKVDTLVIFASFILAYMGVEASASHVNELKNPNRNYPLAMIVLAILTILLDAAGGLAVATTLPASVLDGNLSFGVIEAFRAIFVQHINPNLGWVVFAVALLLALGVLAEISAWIVGPSRALLDTAHDGIIPPSFKKVNKHGVSVQTVVIQAIIVTVWDAVLCGSIALSGGSSSSVGYLTAIGLTVVIYLVGYVLFFLGILCADLPQEASAAFVPAAGRHAVQGHRGRRRPAHDRGDACHLVLPVLRAGCPVEHGVPADVGHRLRHIGGHPVHHLRQPSSLGHHDDRGRVGGGCRRRRRHRRETCGRDGRRAFRPRIGEPLGGGLAAGAFEHPTGCDGQQALAQPGWRVGRAPSERSERAHARRDGLGQLHGCRGQRDQASRFALAGRGRAEGGCGQQGRFPDRPFVRTCPWRRRSRHRFARPRCA